MSNETTKKRKTTRNSNGEGSVYYDKTLKRYRALIRWTDKNGVKHKKEWKDKKQSVVKNKLNEFKRQLLLAQGDIRNEAVTFGEFSQYWLNEMLKPHLKPTSYMRKESVLINQVYPYFENIIITDITHDDVQSMVNDLAKKGYSYSTIKKAYESVGGCIKAYRIKSGTSFNPCEGVLLPASTKNESSIKFYNDEQREAIIAEATRKYNTGTPVYYLGWTIVLLMYTGMRVGEMIALTWNDIDFEERTININKNAAMVSEKDADGVSRSKLINQPTTKTKSGRRIIPMSRKAEEALLKLKKLSGESEYVVVSKLGNQVSPFRIDKAFRKMLLRIGIIEENDVAGVHSLRHTFASMLFKNGCETKIVSEILGHANTKITEDIYIHLIQEQKVKAIQDIDKYGL